MLIIDWLVDDKLALSKKWGPLLDSDYDMWKLGEALRCEHLYSEHSPAHKRAGTQNILATLVW